MKVLIACEYSGRVRDAFIRNGHDAWSCDILPGEGDNPSQHLQGNVLPHLTSNWDLMIAHPPCTHLAVSGARWWKDKDPQLQLDALQFVRDLMAAPIPSIAIENPISKISSAITIPDQIIQPWWFGNGEIKATCLWLKNLPRLFPTNVVPGRRPRVHHMSPGPDRARYRSITPLGIAQAMADQWGPRVNA